MTPATIARNAGLTTLAEQLAAACSPDAVRRIVSARRLECVTGRASIDREERALGEIEWAVAEPWAERWGTATGGPVVLRSRESDAIHYIERVDDGIFVWTPDPAKARTWASEEEAREWFRALPCNWWLEVQESHGARFVPLADVLQKPDPRAPFIVRMADDNTTPCMTADEPWWSDNPHEAQTFESEEAARAEVARRLVSHLQRYATVVPLSEAIADVAPKPPQLDLARNPHPCSSRRYVVKVSGEYYVGTRRLYSASIGVWTRRISKARAFSSPEEAIEVVTREWGGKPARSDVRPLRPRRVVVRDARCDLMMYAGPPDEGYRWTSIHAAHVFPGPRAAHAAMREAGLKRGEYVVESAPKRATERRAG